MRLYEFIKDKWYYLVMQLGFWALLIGAMVVFDCNGFIIYLTLVGQIAVTLLPLLVEYIKKRSFYKEMEKCKDSLDHKYLICELMPRPSFLEGRIVMAGLSNINKNMMDELNVYKRGLKEYKEYIDMWVHEVKTPVTNVMLITENHKSLVTESIKEEMEKIEGYIEQTLYYSKTTEIEKDYAIASQSLESIVRTSIKANKKALIGNRIRVELEELDAQVMTDSKWLVFVLNQIITNCVKYRNEKAPVITFSASTYAGKVTLKITDNGLGIKESELPKVLNKGFVGTNGRKREATTGMGLYICSKLLKKMHHTIKITSKEGEYTTVAITFPKTSYFFER